MKKLLWLLLMCPLFTNGQQVVDVTRDQTGGSRLLHAIAGEAFVNTKFINLVEGSPYFNEEWMKGRVIGKDGQEYKDALVRIDLLEGRLQFRDANGKELIATTPVAEVILTDSGSNNYRFIHSTSMPSGVNPVRVGWYLWLHTGNASLYKSFNKQVSEIKPYSSATTEQRIKTTSRYLIYYSNTFFEVKKIKELPSVLANQRSAMEAYLKNKDDKALQDDDRMTAAIEYYNSLFVSGKD